MFALLFGQPPFQGRDTQQTFRRVSRGSCVCSRAFELHVAHSFASYSLPWAISSDASDVLQQLLQVTPSPSFHE
jgi:hypothetical protein